MTADRLAVFALGDLGERHQRALDVVERRQQRLRLLARGARDEADAMPLRAGVEQVHRTGRALAGDLDARHLVPQLERHVEGGERARLAGTEREGRLAQALAARRHGVQRADARAALGAQHLRLEACRRWPRRPRRRAPPGPGRVSTTEKPAAGEAGELVGEARAPCRRGRCRRRARRPWHRLAPPSAAAIACAAAMRSGANGCGCTAAAVERAEAGASTLRQMALARHWRSARSAAAGSGLRLPRSGARSCRCARDHCAAAAQPLSTTSTTGPEPDSAFSLLGLSTGSASARITSAAASMRISVSHQGVCAGVFSRFSMPTRMRVGGNSMRCGRGGMVRSSHQITGSASRPASSQGLRKAIGPSVMARLPPRRASAASSGSRRPCPAAA